MKLLVNDSKIKASYRDGSFYNMNEKKIEETEIAQVIMSMQEFKEILQAQSEKKVLKKKTKDE
jgi:hypothetical protein